MLSRRNLLAILFSPVVTVVAARAAMALKCEQVTAELPLAIDVNFGTATVVDLIAPEPVRCFCGGPTANGWAAAWSEAESPGICTNPECLARNAERQAAYWTRMANYWRRA